MKSKIAAIALIFILPFTAYAFSSGDTGDSKAYCAKKVERDLTDTKTPSTIK